jgi:hypothetical protein
MNGSISMQINNSFSNFMFLVLVRLAILLNNFINGQ